MDTNYFTMMGTLDLLQSTSSASLLGALMVLLLIYLVTSLHSQAKQRGPPGPRPLPVLGNLLQLDLKRTHSTLLELFKKYRSVFTIYLGPKKVVVLAGYKTVKEALVNYADEFGERDVVQVLEEHIHGNGVSWANGDTWRTMRRFAVTNLRDFGMGKKACEDKIIEECGYLIEVVKKFKGEAFDATEPINLAVSNIICSMVYGSRFEYDDPEFTSLVDRTSRLSQLFVSPSIQAYNLFPWIGKWIKDRKKLGNIMTVNKQQNIRLFTRLKETLNPQMCRGLVDAFLVRKQSLEESGTNTHFHNDNLVATVMNVFSAGSDTTATTLRWGLLFMAKYPEIQEKTFNFPDQVQEEVNRVIGGRHVQVEDRKNLPFTDAVIHETQRLANVVPLALPHKTSRDVTFQGHFIEKGTAVFILLTSVLHDESEWEKPHTFHPAHFLDKDGKFIKPDAFMPFSAGPRSCPGEGLAKMELFIFFTTLLQHFRFSPAPGVSEDELDLTPCVGLTLSPSPHKLCAVYRM